jgi:hypothetical protein
LHNALLRRKTLTVRTIGALTALVLACSFARAQENQREDVVVARFRGASRGMISGKPHLLISIEPAGGRAVQVPIPNNNEDRSEYDPNQKLVETVQDLKPGDLIEVSVDRQRPPHPTVVRRIRPYELKPGEDQPNGYIFKGSEEKTIGKSKKTLVTLGKLGQTIVAEVPDKKGTGGTIEPDPDMIAAMNQLKEGDSVWVEMNGKMLALIEAYVEPITGKFTKYTESEVEGHKLRALEIDQDGKTLTLLVPGRANGKAWITDSNVTRQLSRVRPGTMVQYRAKEDGEKNWLRSIEPAPKSPLEANPKAPVKAR